LPSKDKSLLQLQHFVVSRVSLAKQRFQRNLAVCESALDQLFIEKREIMNGNKKNELTDWWLALIRQGVDQLLKSYNYDFDAVPPEYIDTPPTSLQVVRENLTIIQQLLRAFNATQKDRVEPTAVEKEFQTDIVELLQELKSEVYPKLDDFVAKAQLALQDSFECLDIPFDHLTISSLLKLTHDEMEIKMSRSIDRVLGEITYVEQMKRLENSTTKSDVKDIVPITGLAIGRIVRFENELQTVLEVWENRVRPGEDSKEKTRILAQQ